MFLRLIADNFARRPRRKFLTAAALSLGMAVATAALSVSLDVGDRLAKEFRSLGANLVVTPAADSLPLEIGGVDYRPVNAGAYLPEADLPKIKTVFWHNNIIAFAPVLETRVAVEAPSSVAMRSEPLKPETRLIGTWSHKEVRLTDGSKFETGVEKTNPWWQVEGTWFNESQQECVVGKQLADTKGIKAGDTVSVLSRQQVTPQMRADFLRKTDAFVHDFEQNSTSANSSGAIGFLTKGLRDGLATLHGREDEMEVYENHELKVTGILSSGGEEDNSIVVPLQFAQKVTEKPGQYRKLYVSALTKPEDDFARRDPKTMNPDELEQWSCSPYVSSIAYSIKQVLPGSDVRVIHRVADGEGKILTRVRTLLWLVTAAALLAAALAVGASSAASVIERRMEIGLMKALGARSATVGFLLAAEQLLLALVGGGIGYGLGLLLARFLGTKIFGVPPEPSLLVLGVVLVLAAGVTLLGSAWPLRRAANYDPAPILRGE